MASIIRGRYTRSGSISYAGGKRLSSAAALFIRVKLLLYIPPFVSPANDLDNSLQFCSIPACDEQYKIHDYILIILLFFILRNQKYLL